MNLHLHGHPDLRWWCLFSARASGDHCRGCAGQGDAYSLAQALLSLSEACELLLPAARRKWIPALFIVRLFPLRVHNEYLLQRLFALLVGRSGNLSLFRDGESTPGRAVEKRRAWELCCYFTCVTKEENQPVCSC